MKIPDIHIENMRDHLSSFKDYLRGHGCTIQEASNDYELVRFKSGIGVGVLYYGQKGLSCNVPFVADALNLYFSGEHWQSGKVKAGTRTPSPKRKKELLIRNGDECFYCGFSLGDDITEEHLVSIAQQGSNNLDNIVLAHAKCNQLAGHKSLVEKIHFRDELRTKAIDKLYNGE